MHQRHKDIVKNISDHQLDKLLRRNVMQQIKRQQHFFKKEEQKNDPKALRMRISLLLMGFETERSGPIKDTMAMSLYDIERNLESYIIRFQHQVHQTFSYLNFRLEMTQ